MDLLLVGALLALAWIHHRKTIERYGHLGLLLPPIAAAYLFYLGTRLHVTTDSNSRLSNTMVYEASLVACTGIMLWALSGRWVGVLKLAPVMYLGRISYTVYLIHVTALYLARRAFHNTAAMAAMAFAMTLAYATLSWRFMELPLLGRNPKESSVLITSQS